MAAHKVLFIRRRYLGDIVLLGPVFRNFRLHWPDAHLALLAEANYAAVAQLNPDLNEVLTFPESWTEWPGFILRLRRAKFTHVLDFDSNDKTALTTWLTRSPVRVAQYFDSLKPRRKYAYTQLIPLPGELYNTHSIVETYLHLLSATDVPVVTREIRLVPKPEDIAWARRITGPKSAGSPPRLLVHPGSRSPFRVWPADRFAAVCDRLQDELGAQIFLVAGPAERALVASIRQHAHTHLVAIEEAMSIGQFAALAAECGLLLCHDSGPMHAASAAGAKIIGLYSSQNIAIWHPLGEGHTILQTTLPCTCLPNLPVPCKKDDSYLSYCVRKISVEDVYQVLKARFSTANQKSGI